MTSLTELQNIQHTDGYLPHITYCEAYFNQLATMVQLCADGGVATNLFEVHVQVLCGTLQYAGKMPRLVMKPVNGWAYFDKDTDFGIL